ncbi:Khc [Symbiodinium natans]|uniref:Khc protein n=1 Tax=Symbiodinium natans TaxID=878477 RepID=A0A812IGA5_9DINO|nr:Khc [Symbiodinium natans]
MTIGKWKAVGLISGSFVSRISALRVNQSKHCIFTAFRGTYHGCIAIAHDRVYISTEDKPVLIGSKDDPVPEGIRAYAGFDGLLDQDATQEDVFQAAGKEAVDGVLFGLNAAIMAYGQTSTGKTHTMVGDRNRPGLCLKAAGHLFSEAALSGSQIEVQASFLQLYLNHITDLLVPDGHERSLKLREVVGEEGTDTKVEGLSERLVQSMDDVAAVLEEGNRRRQQACTALNASSSRSHAVLILNVTLWTGRCERSEEEEEGGEAEATQAKLYLVDLAGSERVKDSCATGDRFTEAVHINKSLFALQGVVAALADGKPHIPFRNDPLTQLLRPALGGNCCTTLVATVSPAQKHSRESEGTLNFASSCRRIRGEQPRNSVKRPRPWESAPKAKEEAEEVPECPWASLATLDAAWVLLEGTKSHRGSLHDRVDVAGYASRLMQLRRLGQSFQYIRDEGVCQIHVLTCGPADGEAGCYAVLLLHGCPSDATTWKWLFPALIYNKYRAIAIDMPGCGSSPGTKLSSRSEFNAAKGGPLDIACAVLDALGIAKAAVVGYVARLSGRADALKPRSRVSKLISFHPSYTPPKGNSIEALQLEGENLSAMSVPVLVLWVKEDQFHNLTKWRKNFEALPAGKRELEVYTLGSRWKPGMSLGGDKQLGPQLQRRIVSFLAGEAPDEAVGVGLEKRLEAKGATTAGKLVVHAQNVVVADALDNAGEVARALREVEDPRKLAISEFRQLWTTGKLPALYSERLAGSSASSASLFGALPDMSPEALSDPSALVEAGLWTSAPQGWEQMHSKPRYAAGRRVLVRGAVKTKPSDPDFMALSDKGSDRTTFRACALDIARPKDTLLVDVDASGGEPRLEVPKAEVLRLNQPHRFATSGKHLLLEDGLKCDYSSPLMRAKLCEIALALDPIVQQLDFNNADAGQALQLKAVEVIRKCLDIITFQKGLDRGRSCAKEDDVAKMACHGQGHCHTVSSTMAGFLYPFCNALGIDLKYRGGYSWGGVNLGEKADESVEVADKPERHQWLELTLRPSLTTFICDLWVADAVGSAALRWPMEEAYRDRIYPNGTFNIGQVQVEELERDFDLAE